MAEVTLVAFPDSQIAIASSDTVPGPAAQEAFSSLFLHNEWTRQHNGLFFVLLLLGISFFENDERPQELLSNLVPEKHFVCYSKRLIIVSDTLKD